MNNSKKVTDLSTSEDKANGTVVDDNSTISNRRKISYVNDTSSDRVHAIHKDSGIRAPHSDRHITPDEAEQPPAS